MDTKALKDKILQLAIQGKLVSQNENDEPASVLLDRIKEEKEQLIKDKVIKKAKALPQISDEEKLFELPKQWEWCRISEIVKVISGKSFNSKDFFDYGNGNKSIKITNVGIGKFIQSEGGLLPIEFKVEYKDFIVRENEILIALTRPFIKEGLKICRCSVEYDGALLNQRVAVLKDIYTNNQVQEYLFLYLNSNFVLEYIKENCNISLQPNLSINTLMEMIVPIPPLEEQKRIVDKVDLLFKLIDELDSNKQDLSQNISNARNKVLQLAIQGKLVSQDENDEPASVLLERIKEEKEQLIKEKVIRKEKPFSKITDEEKLFDLPNGWEWCRLGDIGIYKKGPFGSTITKSIFVPKSEDTIKVYEQKNAIQKDWTLGEYYVTKEYFESKLKGFEVFEGDIIVSCAGTIGETYIMPNGIEKGVINQALMKMKLLKGIDIDYFLMYFDFILKESSKESSKGSAIKNIPPFDIFKKMLLPLPPLEEQKRIVDKVNSIMSYFDELEKQLN